MAKKKCKHPESGIQPGKFYERKGSFMTLGPRETVERHVVDWCENCGAIRVREHSDDPWSPWTLPKIGGAS